MAEQDCLQSSDSALGSFRNSIDIDDDHMDVSEEENTCGEPDTGCASWDVDRSYSPHSPHFRTSPPAFHHESSPERTPVLRVSSSNGSGPGLLIPPHPMFVRCSTGTASFTGTPTPPIQPEEVDYSAGGMQFDWASVSRMSSLTACPE